MAELLKTIKIDAVGLDKVQVMIDLLDKYRNELPKELQSQLKELADCDACEFNSKALIAIGQNPNNVSCFVDGIKSEGVVSANVILKRLTVYPSRYDGKELAESNENGFIEVYKYPNNFLMKDNAGNNILGWNK